MQSTRRSGWKITGWWETISWQPLRTASSAAASDEVAAQADGDAAQSASEDASVQGVA